ncbi:MAG: sodium/proline symporter PutP [Pseudomonadales bacterium]
MTMGWPTLTTFFVYLVGMVLIGVVGYRLTDDLADFVLGGRRLGGGVAALSAGASDMSGWLLLGLPGALYALGMNQIWIGVGLAVGAYLNWQLVATRLRVYTEHAGDAITLPDYLENRFLDGSKALRLTSALVILIFFTFYVSAGMVGGAILFEQTFGLDYQTALWVGAAVIVAYTFLGGFLAVCWTDFVQGVLMLLALVAVPIAVVDAVGGWDAAVTTVGAIDPGRLDAFHGMTVLGVVSLLAWGLGYFGQPHILVRFMAVRSADEIPKARLIGMSWMVLALYGAIFTGFFGAAYFATDPLANPETVFIALTQALFNPWVAGVLLAAILAAIMSTIDSQLLVSSSALTEDFYRAMLRRRAGPREVVWVGRGAVTAVALLALWMAQDPESTVLGLVAYAWAGFGATLGPVVLLSLFWRRMTRNGALAGMLVGAATVVTWKQLQGGPLQLFDLYEILPGFVLCTGAIIAGSLLGQRPDSAVEDLFNRCNPRAGSV